jgi:hypothetical protein
LENFNKHLKTELKSRHGNFSYSGDGGRRITVQGQPGEKLETLPEKNKLKANELWVWLKWYQAQALSSVPRASKKQ